MLRLERIRHRYGASEVLALNEFAAARDETWLVLGQSGSGKTTLLHILAGLVRPSEGKIFIDGQELGALSGTRLDRFRGRPSRISGSGRSTSRATSAAVTSS